MAVPNSFESFLRMQAKGPENVTYGRVFFFPSLDTNTDALLYIVYNFPDSFCQSEKQDNSKHSC